MRFFWRTIESPKGLELFLERTLIFNNLLAASFAMANAAGSGVVLLCIMLVAALAIYMRFAKRFLKSDLGDCFGIFINIFGLSATIYLSIRYASTLSPKLAELLKIYLWAVLGISILSLAVPFLQYLNPLGLFQPRMSCLTAWRLLIRGISSILTCGIALFWLAKAQILTGLTPWLLALFMFVAMFAVAFFNSVWLSFIMLLLGVAAAVIISFSTEVTSSGLVVFPLSVFLASFAQRGSGK